MLLGEGGRYPVGRCLTLALMRAQSASSFVTWPSSTFLTKVVKKSFRFEFEAKRLTTRREYILPRREFNSTNLTLRL